MEYKKIVLCGSTRFKKEFLAVAAQLEGEGKQVLMPIRFEHADSIYIGARERAIIDQDYLKHIENSDAVFVIDVNGYTGESTRKEMVYALEKGKPIFYFSKGFVEEAYYGN